MGMPLPDRHPLEGPTGGEHETSLLFHLEGLHPHHIDLGMVTPVTVVEINIYHDHDREPLVAYSQFPQGGGDHLLHQAIEDMLGRLIIRSAVLEHYLKTLYVTGKQL